MKTVLVLYPIDPYAYALIGDRDPPEIRRKYAELYQELIRKRYPDYQITWVMFSDDDNLGGPDLHRTWWGIKIGNKDTVIPSGVTFDQLCERKIYPDPQYILAQFPELVEELVVGGFHLWDCVDKMAECAHKNKIDVRVDYDLTELFFWRIRNRQGFPSGGCIPASWEKSLRKYQKQLHRAGPILLSLANQARVNKPWMP